MVDYGNTKITEHALKNNNAIAFEAKCVRLRADNSVIEKRSVIAITVKCCINGGSFVFAKSF